MNIKKVITAMCATIFIFASIFNNVNINNINAVEDSEIGVIEERRVVSGRIVYGTYNCGDCIIEYDGETDGIVVRSITHVEDKDEIELNIPAYINGIPVTKIASSAFRGYRRLKSVTIPDSVTSIGSWAFRDCSSLTSVTIPDSVTKIYGEVFIGCTSLESVELSNNIKELSHTFASCKHLESVTIPEGVIYIDNAFDGCVNLKSLIIPESVEFFNFNFGNCADELSLTILSDNLYITTPSPGIEYGYEYEYEEAMKRLFDAIYSDRIKIYAHENSTVYNAYKYGCYYNYRDNQEEYEKALNKFNIIDDTDNTYQWYTITQSPDVNNDGRIDASDASDILKYYAYISTGGELSFKDFTALKE